MTFLIATIYFTGDLSNNGKLQKKNEKKKKCIYKDSLSWSIFITTKIR